MKERNYGVDLLRIVSMIGVMTLHILGHGGVLDNTKILSFNYDLAWLLEVCAYCAVDCFVLISGYVSVQARHKGSNIVLLWLETEVYSVVIMLLFTIFYNLQAIDIKECITTFLPVTTSQYWFFSMYFGMMLFVPIIDIFTKNVDLKIEIAILLCITFFCTLFSIVNDNVFELNAGYSVLWFVILYMWGGALCKIQCVYQFDLKIIKCVTVGMIFFTWLSKVLLEYITFKITGRARLGLLFIKYTSPSVLIAGCGLLIIFSNIKCTKIIPLLKTLTPLVFSSYLIQDNKYIRKYFIENRFSFLATKNIFIMIVGIFFFAILCFVVGSGIDLFRQYIFKKLKLKERIRIIEESVLVQLLEKH